MLYLSMSDASYFSLGTDETQEPKPKEGKPRQKSKNDVKITCWYLGIARQGISSQCYFTMTIGNRRGKRIQERGGPIGPGYPELVE
jgi:hypothetical protein